MEQNMKLFVLLFRYKYTQKYIAIFEYHEKGMNDCIKILL